MKKSDKLVELSQTVGSLDTALNALEQESLIILLGDYLSEEDKKLFGLSVKGIETCSNNLAKQIGNLTEELS